MPHATAGLSVGANWRTIEVPLSTDHPVTPSRHTAAVVAPDAGNRDLVRSGERAVYYALPKVPFVALDPAGKPIFSLTLILSRSPAAYEENIQPLIQQSVLSFDVSLELSLNNLEALANSQELKRDADAIEVRPLFAREVRFTLQSNVDSGEDGHSVNVIAKALSTGGAAVRASLGTNLTRDQTLELLAALDGGSTTLALRSEVTYRASGHARRRLTGDWLDIHDFIATRITPTEALDRSHLRSLFDEMVRAGVLVTSVSPAEPRPEATSEAEAVHPDSPGKPPKRRESYARFPPQSARVSVRNPGVNRASQGGSESQSLFDAFVRQSIVILKRLTPALPTVDPGNRYTLRARPNIGFRLAHEEEFAGDTLETIVLDAPLEAVVNGLLDGQDRDAFIRLMSLGGEGGGGGKGGIGPPTRPQRFVQTGGPRWAGDPGDRGARNGQEGSERIAMAIADGELQSVSLKLRPEMASSSARHARNAQEMITCGVAKPLGLGTSTLVGTKLDWYLDDWRLEKQINETAQHLPVVNDPTAPIWPDRIYPDNFWYAPAFELLQPAPNANPQSSPFLFSFRRIGETESGPALEGEIRFTLRRRISEQSQQALAARDNPPASPVPTGNLAVSLVLPFINSNDNALTHHTFPCTVSEEGDTIIATVALATQWVRIAYTLLSNAGASLKPAHLSVAFSYLAYSLVRRSQLTLAFGNKEAVIPVVYSSAQIHEVQGMTYMDATASTLNFNHGAVLLKREAPQPSGHLSNAPWSLPNGRAGAATATLAAVAVRPEVIARPEVLASPTPATLALGSIATPALRPGLEIAEIVRESSYALRTLLRQEQHDAVFPCNVLGAFYRENDDDGGVAVGCRPALELGQVSYRRYERIPELDSVVNGETRYQVYSSMQQPGRFLVLPARYAITRHSPGTTDAYKPRILLYSDEDPVRALRTPIIFTADLQPDIGSYARRELELKLALLAETPIVEYPTAIEAETAYVFQAMDSTPVSAFRTPDSICVSISATAADWPLLFTRLQTGGVLGQVRFILGDGTEMTSNLTLDLRNITGPWAGGAVTTEKTAGGVRLTNRIDRPVSVQDLMIVSGGSARLVPVERMLSAGGSDTVVVDQLAVEAELHPVYTMPSTPEAIEAVPNAIERIHVNVLFTNQILFSNHALTAITIFVRRAGSETSEQIHLVADTTVVQVDFLLPLTEYISQPVVQLRIVKAFSDGRNETKDWFDWDLNSKGFVVSLTWELVE